MVPYYIYLLDQTLNLQIMHLISKLETNCGFNKFLYNQSVKIRFFSYKISESISKRIFFWKISATFFGNFYFVNNPTFRILTMILRSGLVLRLGLGLRYYIYLLLLTLINITEQKINSLFLQIRGFEAFMLVQLILVYILQIWCVSCCLQQQKH